MAAAADRHLLFGLLALQVGLDRPGRSSSPPSRPGRSTRPGPWPTTWPPAATSSRRPGRRRGDGGPAPQKHGGDAEKSLAAIPAGRSTRERLAGLGDPDIEPTLGRVASAPGSTERRRRRPHGSYAVGSATSDGQRFRVLRPHARGGLGAVFVALDDELNREVALKQILDRHADDPISRQRFLLEAEVTGGLEHPGIVPVYGLGTYADGRPYYAMRFIRGDSLKEAIERYHADAAAEADAGPPVARAAQAPAAVPRRLQRRSTTPIAAACSIATSSRGTSSSAGTARRWWSTGAWPRPPARASRGPASGRWSPARPAAAPRRCPARRWGRRPT